MHELSIAQSILNTVLQEKTSRQLPHILKIVVHIGALSDVVPEALKFGFDAIKQDTALAETELHIEIIPVRGQCKACGNDFDVQNFVFTCPHCQSGQIQMVRGDELHIAYLEVEETPSTGTDSSRNREVHP